MEGTMKIIKNVFLLIGLLSIIYLVIFHGTKKEKHIDKGYTIISTTKEINEEHIIKVKALEDLKYLHIYITVYYRDRQKDDTILGGNNLKKDEIYEFKYFNKNSYYDKIVKIEIRGIDGEYKDFITITDRKPNEYD